MCHKIAGGDRPSLQHSRASAPACLPAGSNACPTNSLIQAGDDRRVVPKIWDGTASVPPSNLDGVALHLVIKGRALNAEQLGGLLLVTVCLGQRLKNRLSLHIIETGHAAAAHRSKTRL